MNRKVLFDTVRSTVFKGAIDAPQVQGVDALLDACDTEGVTDPRQIAYVLATPMVETGGTFIPIVENLNYSVEALVAKFGNRITRAQAAQFGRSPAHNANQEAIANCIYGGAWGAANLGNTQSGDGWAFRGRGLCQITGRRNYTKFGIVDAPDSAAILAVAADVMVKGMRDGIFTGRKLSDYFGSTTDWVSARKIINGLDRAGDIANYAQQFYKGVQAAI